MPDLKLEVGKTYLSNRAERVRIVASLITLEGNRYHPSIYMSDIGRIFSPDGRCVVLTSTDDYGGYAFLDVSMELGLVEEVATNQEKESIAVTPSATISTVTPERDNQITINIPEGRQSPLFITVQFQGSAVPVTLEVNPSTE